MHLPTFLAITATASLLAETTELPREGFPVAALLIGLGVGAGISLIAVLFAGLRKGFNARAEAKKQADARNRARAARAKREG